MDSYSICSLSLLQLLKDKSESALQKERNIQLKTRTTKLNNGKNMYRYKNKSTLNPNLQKGVVVQLFNNLKFPSHIPVSQ